MVFIVVLGFVIIPNWKDSNLCRTFHIYLGIITTVPYILCIKAGFTQSDFKQKTIGFAEQIIT